MQSNELTADDLVDQCRLSRRREVPEGASFQLSEHAHPRIPDITIMPPRDEWFHYLVCLEDGSLVLDPTARQYDRRENPVRKLSLVQLQKEWLYYWAEPVDPN